jgi:NAD(P)-dependent dehydrogenase (short-subunit alcohol dehydrogenase family)
MKDFKNKVAVITGSGSGMGRELAIELANAGANIALVEINEETLNETAELLKKYNVGVSKHIVDVGNKQAVFDLPEKVIEEHGSVDMVFNNAGVALSSTVENSTDEDWEWGLGILLYGVINGTRAFLPFLKDRPEAAIINTSSIFGLLSVPNQSIYHVGKYGVRGFTESLALEMKMEKSNVEVYSVHPGHIGTNIANIGAKNGKFDFDEDAEDGPNLFGAQAKTVEEAGQLFKDKAPINANTAAKIILKNIKKKNKRILVGSDAYAYDLIQRIFPKWYIYLLPLVFLVRRLFPKDKPLNR